jgi:hypothetical protein
MSCRIFWDRTGWIELLPIPFAVIVILLILRTPRALLLVPLYVVVWLIAYGVAIFMVPLEWGPYPGPCAGGVIGGLGYGMQLVLFARAYSRSILSEPASSGASLHCHLDSGSL